jgi:hypothetical protein
MPRDRFAPDRPTHMTPRGSITPRSRSEKPEKMQGAVPLARPKRTPVGMHPALRASWEQARKRVLTGTPVPAWAPPDTPDVEEQRIIAAATTPVAVVAADAEGGRGTKRKRDTEAVVSGAAVEALAKLRQNSSGYTIDLVNRVPKPGVNQFPRDTFVAKYAALATDGPNLIKLANPRDNSRTYYYSEEGMLYLLCTLCKTLREATTDNFSAANVNGDRDKWFAKMPPSFQLGTNGCNACFAQQSSVRDSTGDGLLKSLGTNYPAIFHVYTDAEKEAFRAQYRAANGGRELKRVPQNDSGLAYLRAKVGTLCPVSGVVMNDIKGDPFCVSVDSVNLQTEGKYDQSKKHELKDLQIVSAFVNIQQVSTNIPNLALAFRSLYEAAIRAVMRTDVEEAAEELASVASPYPKVLQHLASHGVEWDKFQKVTRNGKRVPRAVPRFNNLETSDKVATFLRAKGMRCATSGVVVCLRSGWNKAHMDRIDDADGHNTSNVDLKCVLFMGKQKVSRKQFLELILAQKVLPVPDEARALFEADMRTIV